MTDPARHHDAIPTPAERAMLNAALVATGADSGFWDEHGRPAPLARRHRGMEARHQRNERLATRRTTPL